MDELTLGGKTYISSKRAAEITGYAKDYVGQLCREGFVEAKMVGRSWYVLESSIREHRFGSEEKEQVPEEMKESVIPETEHAQGPGSKESAVREVVAGAWTPATYVAEVPKAIPAVEPKPAYVPTTPPSESTAAISDMQAAWKEWFAKKQEHLPEPVHEPLLESPEVVEAREEAAEDLQEEPESETGAEEVPIQVVREADPVEIPLQKMPEPVEVPIVRIREDVRPRTPFVSNRGRTYAAESQKSSLVTRALLVSIAFVAIAIGAIGTGYADRVVGDSPIVRFLGGTSTVIKQ